MLLAARARMDGSVAAEQVGAVRNPEPTFAPPAFTPLPPPRSSVKGTVA
ncbi:MAG: hypothetical protein ACLP01_26235 [Solirubrobacteraceae bacterium]